MKKQSIAVWVMATSLLLSTTAYAGEAIAPLRGEEVTNFVKRLNSQGIIVKFGKDVKEDKIDWAHDSSFFMLGDGQGYSLYRADINNDGKEEYVLCSAGGSGGFFDIDAVYQENDGKLVDILSQIRTPMRKLIRDAEKESYDLEEGYTGYMNGSIKIEKEGGQVFFTLKQVTRNYEDEPVEDDYNPPQEWKFLWDKDSIKLVN